MRKKINHSLKRLSAQMREDKTSIEGYYAPDTDSTRNRKKTSFWGKVTRVRFNKRFKPVNNHRRLKKAYRRGGTAGVIAAIEFYSKKD